MGLAAAQHHVGHHAVAQDDEQRRADKFGERGKHAPIFHPGTEPCKIFPIIAEVRKIYIPAGPDHVQ